MCSTSIRRRRRSSDGRGERGHGRLGGRRGCASTGSRPRRRPRCGGRRSVPQRQAVVRKAGVPNDCLRTLAHTKIQSKAYHDRCPQDPGRTATVARITSALICVLAAWPARAAEPLSIDLWPGKPPGDVGIRGEEKFFEAPPRKTEPDKPYRVAGRPCKLL